MKKMILSVLAAVSFMVGSAGQEIAGLKPLAGSKSFLMKNGMTLIFIPDEGSACGSIYMGFRAGSFFDGEGRGGQSQLLARLAYKGTRHIGTAEWESESALLEELGRVGDEITMKHSLGKSDGKDLEKLVTKALELRKKLSGLSFPDEMKGLYDLYGAVERWCSAGDDLLESLVSFPRDSIEHFMLLESERIRDPVFRDFYEEREILAMEEESRDFRERGRDYKLLLSSVYGEGPYSRAWISGAKDFRRLTLKEMAEYGRRAFNPDGAVLVISGDYDYAKVLALCSKYFETIPSGAEPLYVASKVVPGRPLIPAEKNGIEKPVRILSAYLKPEGYSQRTEALTDLLVSYLSGGGSGPLVEEGSGKFVGGAFRNGDPGGLFRNMFLARLRLREGVTAAQGEMEARKFFENLHAKELEASTLERARRALISDVMRRLERQGSRSKQAGEWFLLSGSADFAVDYMKKVASASPDEVRTFCRELFAAENFVGVQKGIEVEPE